ncbi:hypothetical protein Y1Q_0014670 [Alligator mississippiensis]|uniref:Uncharacterized protein n=1 Tax=Alligator mississippiensis TaxID=8496 RepID=A0A151P810_ALLMI|nr:hypothetical protein Y1Q_0014670 [Alligator mississippiensis]
MPTLSVSSLKSLSCHPTLDCYRKGDVDSSQSWAAKTRKQEMEVEMPSEEGSLELGPSISWASTLGY